MEIHYKKVKGKLVRFYPKPFKISKAKEKQIDKICKEVIKEIRPTTEQRVTMIVQSIIIMKIIKDELGDDVNFCIGGSLGKNTDLRQGGKKWKKK